MKLPWMLVLVVAAGCGKGSKDKPAAGSGDAAIAAAAPVDAAPPAVTPAQEARFPHVEVTRTVGPLPGKLLAPLPRSRAELEDFDRRDEWIDDQLYGELMCAGDLGLRARSVEAVSAAPPADQPELIWRLASWVGSCHDRSCPWLTEALPGSAGVERALLAQLAVGCEDPALDPLFEEAATPDQAVIGRAEASSRYSPRLDAIAHAWVAGTESGKRAFALRALGYARDPRAMAVLLALHGEATDDDAREAITAELTSYRDDPAAAPIVAAYCRRHPDNGNCQVSAPDEPSTPATVESLQECVREQREVNRRLCLDSLLVLDRALTVTMARPLLDEPDLDVRTRDWVEALLRFPAPGALAAHLRELGLLGPGALAVDDRSVTAMEALRASRAATWVMTSAGLDLGDLRGDLAPLLPRSLGSVFFDEGPDRQVSAYVNGAIYTATADDATPLLTTWVGLINGVLAGEHSQVRCLNLYVKEEVPSVLCGPVTGLVRALDDKLFGSADQTPRPAYQ